MKAEYIKVNGEIYLYVIITDDSGVRVEVRPQNSIITGNEQPVIKRYITSNMKKEELEKNIECWINESKI